MLRVYEKHKHKFDEQGRIARVTKEHRQECKDHADLLNIEHLEYANLLTKAAQHHRELITPKTIEKPVEKTVIKKTKKVLKTKRKK